jgi:hypothetical protein
MIIMPNQQRENGQNVGLVLDKIALFRNIVFPFLSLLD